MPNEKLGAVRILDLLPEEAIRKSSGPVLQELDSLPLYTVVGNGTLKVNMGVRKNMDEVIVYDVTKASEALREAYSDQIVEYHVNEILDEKKTTATPNGQIRTMLSLLGEYQNLTSPEKERVGHEYVTLESTEDGLKIKPLLSIKTGLPGNTYLEVDTIAMGEELSTKLASDLTELVQKDNGLYEQKDLVEQQKEL